MERLTVAEVLKASDVDWHGFEPRDRDVVAQCGSCDKYQTLEQAVKSDSDAVGRWVLYSCKHCAAALVETGEWGFGAPGEHRRAYRLGDMSLYLTVPAVLRTPNGGELIFGD